MSSTSARENWQELDKSSHFHPFTDLTEYAATGGRVVNQAEHIYIRDAEGNRILDGMSGLWCCNLGYSQKGIVDAVHEQLQTLPYYNSFFNCSNDKAHRIVGGFIESYARAF